MAGTIWIPGAERLHASAPGGTITSTAPPRVVWHTVEAPAGKDSTFASMIRVLTGKSAEPQVLYDPVTDRLGQFIPLDLSGRALKNDGATKTNRTGRVCIQIEVMGYSAHPFTDTWKPGPNFRNLMAAIRSWGIPDAWPSGPPPKYIDGRGNVPADERSRTIWLGKAGHYGHSQVPGNSHGDPGAINTSKLFAAAKTTAPTPAAPPKTAPLETEVTLDELMNAQITGKAADGSTKSFGTFKGVLWTLMARTADDDSRMSRIETKLNDLAANLPKA
jgi:hypothetical protein